MATRDSAGILVFERDEAGFILMGYFSGAVPADTNKFAPGCFLIGSNGKQYTNKGSAESPSFEDNNVITTAEIADDAVTSEKIAAGAVGSSEIADGSVAPGDIAP